jgi:hypothetical protein
MDEDDKGQKGAERRRVLTAPCRPLDATAGGISPLLACAGLFNEQPETPVL